jgi:pimeloyl-ACP methyl ester carboxylesterase
MNDVKIHRGMAKLGEVYIFYRDTRTQGPTILCLHGRWGRGETWVDFMKHYGDAYRVIAPDQRGHGLSGKPPSTYSAEEMASDMVGLLRFLDLDSVILVGHSMGGRIAGHMAALHPSFVKALAILDKAASGPTTAQPIAEEDPLTKDWPMPFASLAEARSFLLKTMDSQLACDYFMNSLEETVEGYRMMFSSRAMAANIAHEGDWFHLLSRITCPVLLVRSSSHEAVSDEDLERMRSLLPDCACRDMSQPDHNVHLSDLAEFYRCFDGFLERIGASPASQG